MITQEKLKIYSNFQGDVDGWVRMGSRKQKAIMTDDDWALIDTFLQDITLVKKGLASIEYSENLQKRLKENCENEETISQLKNLVDKEW